MDNDSASTVHIWIITRQVPYMYGQWLCLCHTFMENNLTIAIHMFYCHCWCSMSWVTLWHTYSCTNVVSKERYNVDLVFSCRTFIAVGVLLRSLLLLHLRTDLFCILPRNLRKCNRSALLDDVPMLRDNIPPRPHRQPVWGESCDSLLMITWLVMVVMWLACGTVTFTNSMLLTPESVTLFSPVTFWDLLYRFSSPFYNNTLE
jgi:hypothetical protein